MATSMRHVKRRERLKKFTKMKRESQKQPSSLLDQKWKPFEVDMSAFADKEMGGFVGIEILTDYDPNLLKKQMSGTMGKGSKSSKKLQDKKKTLPSKETVKKKTKGDKKKEKKGVDDPNPKSPENPENPEKNILSKEKQDKSADMKTRTKEQSAQSKGKDMKDTLQSKEVELEASPGKSRIRKRKSGKQKLREMRAKRKRRKSEQEREEQEREAEAEKTEAEKTDPKDSLDESGEDTAGEKISSEVSMSTWDTLSIPTVVHESLQTMGFASPTPIQAGCIPAAINEGKDIVGAAETGSGKTLAFGIPLIYRILQHEAALVSGLTSVATADPTEDESGQDGLEGEAKDEGSEQDDEEGMEDDERDGDDPSMMMTGMEANEGDDDLSDDDVDVDDDIDDSDDDVEDDDSDDDDGEQVDMQKLKTQMKCVDVVDNIADEDWLKAGLPLTSTPAGGLDQEKKLFGLVLTPTRELAVQVKNHLVAAAKKTNIKVAVVVGGMSAEKQKRVLKKRPDIIVGTPGRLWELYQLGEPHLASLPDVKCLIIDEADRMVEKGHYAELSEILDILNTSEQRSSRQTFVFSATLSLIHLGPLRKSLKKAYKQDKKDKLDSVMAKIGIKEDAEVVDLTKREGTASSLLESKIVCAVEEKDIYLFYFLRQYPGRTLVFTNSIDCIRRLASILTLLDCKPLPLHSSMHQKQRLKNLERFTGNPKGLLLATDVAARGLDIPDIEHVIHYQVPRTSESYVHRSGRTARQAKVGLSVTLVSPNEMNFYRRLCKTLNRDSVMAKIGIKEDAEVVDLTKREGTASSLLESKIVCAVEEKDIYLFYFLRQYPGRTLVFTNSIDCIRRLASILTLLDCKPLPLHSSMHQKQRLKNLERFTGNPKGLLLATDVAARGLDIPDIEHVIHYQVPRTSESYVHRSGRTARQAKVGLSVTLVSPNEMNFYRRLCKTLNREEIPSFPVEHSYYQAVNERVELARDIDKLEHVSNKKKHQNDWFVRAAKELDVDVDEHLNLHDMGDSSEQKQFNKKLRIMRGTLKALLKRRIFAAGYSQRYLTANGKFQSPFSQATVGSHEAFSKMKARMKKDKADDSKEKDKKRKKFKRMGRYQTKK
eukprot:XP_011680969.1 PREDICTED: ATP-dependent RNA helicase DDX24 [Strongylocentrotus purpuratus]